MLLWVFSTAQHKGFS